MLFQRTIGPWSKQSVFWPFRFGRNGDRRVARHIWGWVLVRGKEHFLWAAAACVSKNELCSVVKKLAVEVVFVIFFWGGRELGTPAPGPLPWLCAWMVLKGSDTVAGNCGPVLAGMECRLMWRRGLFLWRLALNHARSPKRAAWSCMYGRRGTRCPAHHPSTVRSISADSGPGCEWLPCQFSASRRLVKAPSPCH